MDDGERYTQPEPSVYPPAHRELHTSGRLALMTLTLVLIVLAEFILGTAEPTGPVTIAALFIALAGGTTLITTVSAFIHWRRAKFAEELPILDDPDVIDL